VTERASQIILIGPPGAGKSTVGAELAQRLGAGFRDTDEDVAAMAAKPVPDIFLEDGEDAFREMERVAARRALDEHGGVLALGSGAVLDPGLQRALKARTVVYLAADFSTVAKRAGLDRPRVVLPGNPRGRLRTMMSERHPLYESLATITVQADDGGDPAEVAAEIAARLRGNENENGTAR
jgi:shikimate kinase